MSKQDVITQATQLLEQLPDDKAAEVVALLTRAVKEASEDLSLQEYYFKLVQKKEDESLSRDITWLVENGGAFDWLHDEPDIYTEADVKFRYDQPAE